MRLQAEVSRLAADVKDTQSSVVTVQSSVTNLSISDITGLQAALDGKVNVP